MLDVIISLDSWVANYLATKSSPSAVVFFELITKFGGLIIGTLVFLCISYFLWRSKRHLLEYFILAVLVNESLVVVFKTLSGRLRPLGAIKYGEFSASFPSGHSAICLLLYGYICYLTIRYYRSGLWRNLIVTFLTVLILLVGFSRIYLNVHYLSDVLGGYLIGGAVLIWLIKKSLRQLSKKPR